MPRSYRFSRRLRILVCSIGLALALPALALADTARFEIEAEPLPAALKAFAQQAHMQLLYEYDIVRNVQGNSVIGVIEKRAALKQLLRNTGLEAVFRAEDAATIRQIPAHMPKEAPKSTPNPKDGGTKREARKEDIPRAMGMQKAADSSTSVDSLQVIVVTAQRRRQKENTVPVAITAFTGASLRELSINTVSDLQNLVPSMTVVGSYDRDDYLVAIRGMGPTAGGGQTLGGGGDAVVSYFADVPINAGGPGLFFDLENVQVLNGPQGTLFGKNTTGGAVLFVPNRPTDKFGGNLEVDAGDYGMRGLTGVVNIPIVANKVLLRISAKAYQENGFTTDRGPDFRGRQYDNQSYWAGRVSLVVRPTESFENYTIFSYLRDKDHGDGFVLTAVNPAGTYASLLIPYLAQQQAAGIRSTSFDTFAINDRLRYGMYNTSKWEVSDNLQFKDILSYQVSKWRNAEDLDASPFEILDNVGPATGWHERTGVATEEAQLQGNALNRNLKWTVGGYYEYDYPIGPQRYANFVDYLSVVSPAAPIFARDHAGYGELTYDFGGVSDSLRGVKLTAGYRYTWDRYGYGIAVYSPTFGNRCFTAAGVYPASNCLYLDNSGESSGASWTLGLEDQINADNLIYIRSAQGYIPGGFNPGIGMTGTLGPSAAEYRFLPETDVDVELGVKSLFSIRGMKGNVDANVFQTDFTNIQRQVAENIVDKFGVSEYVGFVTNASEAVIRGFELQGVIIPVKTLKIAMTYSYNEGKYTKLNALAAPSLAGIPFAQLPKNKASLTTTYTVPLDPQVGMIDLSGTYSYQSRYFYGGSIEPHAFIQPYGLLNLRLDWNDIYGSAVDASALVTNVTNKEYVVSQFGDYLENGYVADLYGVPRMFGVQLRYSFGQ